jgi:hypothetical protein
VLGHTDSGLTNGVDYFYKVSAVNLVGEGPQSDEQNATPVGTPSEPQNLLATSGDGKVVLSWDTPNYTGPGTMLYHLFRDGVEISLMASSSFVDTDLTNFVTYSYKVAASNPIGWGPNSTTVLAVPLPGQMRPSAPRNLTVSAGRESVTLTWETPLYSNASALSGFMIFYGTSINSMSDHIALNLLTYVINGLTKGQGYYFKVAAQNSAGLGLNSTIHSVTPFGEPSAPTNFQAEAGDSYVQLSWIIPSYSGPGSLTYHLFRDGALLLSGEMTTYNDTSVINGVTYAYKVVAKNSVGWGTNASISAIPSMALIPPGMPDGFHANKANGHIALTWSVPTNPGSSAIIGYKVYRGATAESVVLIATVGGTTFVDEGAQTGQTYYYKVSAVNAAGESLLTEAIPAFLTPSAPPVDYTWLAIAGIVGSIAVIGAVWLILSRRK